MKALFDKIYEDISDCISGKFKFNLAAPTELPQEYDGVFSCTQGLDKQGSNVITCALVVNIKNMAAITELNSSRVTGKVYTALVKACSHIINVYQGQLCGVQSDQLLFIFPTRNSFRNAVETAITINTVVKKQFHKLFNLQGLKLELGMGIAHGQLLGLKADISNDDPDDAQVGYRKVIWSGEPIQTAKEMSKIALSSVKTELVKVSYSLPNPYYPDSFSTVTRNYFYPDFLETLQPQGEELKSSKGKITKIEPFILKEEMPPILLSAPVYNGYQKRNGEEAQADREGWAKISLELQDKHQHVFGGDVVWDI